MIWLVHELAADCFPVAVTCRVLQVAPSKYYEAIKGKPSAWEIEDRDLTGLIVEVHQDSRGTYGAPRVHAELRKGLGLRIGRKRVARLMRNAGLHGMSDRRKRRHRPDTATHDDLVKRHFTAEGPDRVWFMDITQHRASDGWVNCCAVIDAWSPAKSWAGRSLIRCTQSWLSTPWRWRVSNDHPTGLSCTPTGACKVDSTGRRPPAPRSWAARLNGARCLKRR